MIIKKIEKKVLFGQKLRDGKSYEDAGFEIEYDEAFQENLKVDIKKLKKENEYLKSKLEKMQNIVSKNIIPRENKDSDCAIGLMNRIIKYIKDNPNSNKKKIAYDCMIDKDKLREGIDFLFKNSILTKISKSGVEYYSWNENLLK